MVLFGVGIVLLVLAVAARLPRDRVPPWVRLYVWVAVACALFATAVIVLA